MVAAMLKACPELGEGGEGRTLSALRTFTPCSAASSQSLGVLGAIGVTANKQIVPDDPRPPLRPSGLRLGTPACTTRGMSEEDMTTIARWIVRTLRRPDDVPTIEALRAEVKTMCRRYPMPGVP